MRTRTKLLTLSVLCSALYTASTLAADLAGKPGRSSGKPNPLNNVYFGEQHLHTQNSPDAFAMATRNTTDQLLFIAVVFSLIAVLKRLPLTAPQGGWLHTGPSKG